MSKPTTTAEVGEVVDRQSLDDLLDQCRTAILWDSDEETHIGLQRRKAMAAIDQYRELHKGEPSAVDALRLFADCPGWREFLHERDCTNCHEEDIHPDDRLCRCGGHERAAIVEAVLKQ